MMICARGRIDQSVSVVQKSAEALGASIVLGHLISDYLSAVRSEIQFVFLSCPTK
jgi:hypothetical protein